MSEQNVIYTKKDIKEIEQIASFYNNYKPIPFGGDITKLSYETYSKSINKIVGDIYTIVLPSLSKILENNDPKTPIGLLLTQLVVDNFIKEKTFIEVQLNLKELKKLSILLELDKKLQTALGFLVP